MNPQGKSMSIAEIDDELDILMSDNPVKTAAEKKGETDHDKLVKSGIIGKGIKELSPTEFIKYRRMQQREKDAMHQ
jgi:hypothetical protein